MSAVLEPWQGTIDAIGGGDEEGRTGRGRNPLAFSITVLQALGRQEVNSSHLRDLSRARARAGLGGRPPL